MSRTTNGFHAMLWGIGRLGVPENSKRNWCIVDNDWRSPERAPVTKGDKVVQTVTIERKDGTKDVVEETWRVSWVERVRGGYKDGYRVRFDRVE